MTTTTLTRDELIRKVNEVLAASSCCPELRDKAQAYLDSVDKENEDEAREALFQELREDVCLLDQVIPFFESEAATKIFGEQEAKLMTKMAKEKKAIGGKYCICPACTAGGVILDSLK